MPPLEPAAFIASTTSRPSIRPLSRSSGTALRVSASSRPWNRPPSALTANGDSDIAPPVRSTVAARSRNWCVANRPDGCRQRDARCASAIPATRVAGAARRGPGERRAEGDQLVEIERIGGDRELPLGPRQARERAGPLQPGHARLRGQTRVTSSRSPSRVPSASVSHFCSPAISVNRRNAMIRIDATSAAVSGDAAVTAAGVSREQIERKRQPHLPVVEDHFGVLDGARQQRRSPVTIRMRPRVMAAGAPDRDVVKIDATRGKTAADAEPIRTGWPSRARQLLFERGPHQSDPSTWVTRPTARPPARRAPGGGAEFASGHAWGLSHCQKCQECQNCQN